MGSGKKCTFNTHKKLYRTFWTLYVDLLHMKFCAIFYGHFMCKLCAQFIVLFLMVIYDTFYVQWKYHFFLCYFLWTFYVQITCSIYCPISDGQLWYILCTMNISIFLCYFYGHFMCKLCAQFIVLFLMVISDTFNVQFYL